MFSIVIIVFCLFFLTMAVGVLLGRKPLAGSCGGLANVGLNGECKICGRAEGSCESDSIEGSMPRSEKSMSYDAMAKVKLASSGPAQKASIRDRFKDPLDF